MSKQCDRKWTALVAAAFFAGCHNCEPHHPRAVYPSPPPTMCPPIPCGGEVTQTDWPPKPQLVDLPSALQLANAQNPEIAMARERINEALAHQEGVDLLWLPDLQFGPAWTRHDGQIQRSTGEVITVSRSSLFVGGGPVLTLDLAEAIFAPLAARQVTAARQAGALAATNRRTLDVAVAYIDLLQVYAELQISAETVEHARRLLNITKNYEKTGKGVAADTARARTEYNLRLSEQAEIEGRIAVTSARLVQLLNLDPQVSLRPVEPALVPMSLVPERAPLAELLAQAMSYRPELTENQALIAAAIQRWRAAKIEPLVPKLGLGLSAGGFGGGANSFFGDFDGRSDFSALAVWQLRSFGLGDAVRVRERQSQYNQAVFQQNTIEAMVASEVVSAFGVAFSRRRELDSAQLAVAAARDSYQLNEERIRRAPDQARPIELLQAIQALERARHDYLRVVADYNRAQFRLYTALGNPSLCALDSSVAVQIQEATVPSDAAKDRLPAPEKLGKEEGNNK